MRICHISGGSVHTRRWIKWLADRGHKNYLITNAEIRPIDNVEIYNVRWDHWYRDRRPRWARFKELSFHDTRTKSLKPFIEMRRIIKKISPDILQSHSLKFPGYLGNYLNFHPYVVTVMNGDVLWIGGKLVTRWQKFHTKLGLRIADIVTGVSETLVQACIRLGAYPKKTYVIRRGVDINLFSSNNDQESSKTQLGLNTGKVVLSPRNMEDIYNIDTLIRAIPSVTKEIDDVTFVFFWLAGSQREFLEKLAQELGVWEKVRFVGTIPYEHVPLYHKAADIMLSIPFSDTGPVALLEAMASGDVPVLSDLPCVREWIIPGWNGILVDPHDTEDVAGAIIDLLKDDSKRALFAERNYNLVRERGDQDKEMGKVEELYYALFH